ncbi:MAG: hypothetical protein NTW06_04140, partial [Candidatus Falkowbacteria bacterium]|nr:hypothetical protein [Candidatus Falkowbacteria bacterium]
QSGGKKTKGKTKAELKVLVNEGGKVSAGDNLFAVGNYKVKAQNTGLAKIDNKGVKVLVETEKVKEFIVPKEIAIIIKDGDQVKKGDQLTDGSLDLQQLYKLRNKLDTQKYIIKEIQSVYSSQGQPLNDKHIEIIVKQMFSRYFIQDPGDTDLLPSEIVEEVVVARVNDAA